MRTTRFAPSPTGYLHLGHAYAALFALHAARDRGGRFLLRIEDIDTGRCRPEFDGAILEDLAWLGIDWDGEPRRQSAHLEDYRAALARLTALGVTYPCFCSRQDIARAATAPHGADGAIYPGTCRSLPADARARRIAEGQPYAIRLDIAAGLALTGPLSWRDLEAGTVAAEPSLLGDVVIARRDVPSSYHLAVTTDDEAQGVTLVTRGVDLFPSTHIHRLLQELLGYRVPDYHHHILQTNAEGVRFSKRDGALAIRSLRQAGKSPEEVRSIAGWR